MSKNFRFNGESNIFEVFSIAEIENYSLYVYRQYDTHLFTRIINLIQQYCGYELSSGFTEFGDYRRHNPVEFWKYYGVYTVNDLVGIIRSKKIYELRGMGSIATSKVVPLLKYLIYAQTGIIVDQKLVIPECIKSMRKPMAQALPKNTSPVKTVLGLRRSAV